jgi:hypothetical protein
MKILGIKLSVLLTFCTLISAAAVSHGAEVGQWEVFETSYETTKQYANPFTNVEVNVAFRQGDKQWIIPAFWAGGSKWTVRFAPPAEGEIGTASNAQTNPIPTSPARQRFFTLSDTQATTSCGSMVFSG